MTKTNIKEDHEGVSALIQNLDSSVAEAVSEIRQIFLSTDQEIGEQIKWNSPSFFYKGTMKDFNPKEYKRDIAVINLRKCILLIFPTGASIHDTTGLLEGNYSDGRRMIGFKDKTDVILKKEGLRKIINEWLLNVEKC